jgi:hypothetical protein
VRAIAFLLVTFLGGCATGDAGFRSNVDFMFRESGVVLPDALTLTSPSLVSELNGAYTIHLVGLHSRSALASDGVLTSGQSRVFQLDFIDHGDISILRTDDKALSLRAELGPDGKVVRALLGGVSGVASDGFKAFANDTFESGTWQLLYDGPDIVVGRLDLKFRKYSVSGNFRAPRLR